jgi:hypothetical protein
MRGYIVNNMKVNIVGKKIASQYIVYINYLKDFQYINS